MRQRSWSWRIILGTDQYILKRTIAGSQLIKLKLHWIDFVWRSMEPFVQWTEWLYRKTVSRVSVGHQLIMFIVTNVSCSLLWPWTKTDTNLFIANSIILAVCKSVIPVIYSKRRRHCKACFRYAEQVLTRPTGDCIIIRLNYSRLSDDS